MTLRDKFVKAGLSVLADKPFQVGDKVRVNEQALKQDTAFRELVHDLLQKSKGEPVIVRIANKQVELAPDRAQKFLGGVWVPFNAVEKLHTEVKSNKLPKLKIRKKSELRNIGIDPGGPDAHDYYDIQKIKKSVEEWKDDIIAKPDDYGCTNDDEYVEIFLDTISRYNDPSAIMEFFGPEHFGYHKDEERDQWYHEDQPEEFFDELGEDDSALELVWKSDFLNEMGDDIGAKVDLEYVHFYFGSNEGDGSFGLIASFNKEALGIEDE